MLAWKLLSSPDFFSEASLMKNILHVAQGAGYRGCGKYLTVTIPVVAPNPKTSAFHAVGAKCTGPGTESQDSKQSHGIRSN